MKYTEDENGYITIPNNPISKSGVFQYLGSSISPELVPDQVYNVWRPEEELNNPDTIESFRLTPWIPEHVMLGEGFTPAEDVGVQGVTGETVEFSNGTLYSKLKLFGEDLKKLIRAGLKELSCGFRCAWEIKSGVTPQGEAYDVIQRQIRGNHLASVESARMGSDVRVAMDRAVFALDSLDINQNPNGETMTLEEALAKIAELEAQLAAKAEAEDECAKDQEGEDPEKKAEDEESDTEKKEDDKVAAMDAAIKRLTAKVKSLEAKPMAMDGKALMKEFTAKQELATQASAIVGAFDHSDMDANGVAKYALKKLNIACDSGAELAMFKGFLMARKPQTFTVDKGVAKDGADVAKSANLDKAGL
jgi:hypothetical protein